MARDFFTTKVTLEVTISHQFDPQLAAGAIILHRLLCPAVESVEISSIYSNYSDSGIPLDFLQPVFVQDDEKIHGGQ